MENSLHTAPQNNRPLPFQEVLRRRRKYNVTQYSSEIPLELHIFDVLYLNGKIIIDAPYIERRTHLIDILKENKMIKCVKQIVSSSESEIINFMKESIDAGHEGLVAKDLKSLYKAGKREFVWMKLKGKTDTLDTVVVGAYYGKGRRSGTFGSFLLAIKDIENYKTISRVGSGLKDVDLEDLTKIISKYETDSCSENVVSFIKPDVWIKPEIVFEILYEEIQPTFEEKHSAGFGLRFPRFLKIRDDKTKEEINTVEDIRRLYAKKQLNS